MILLSSILIILYTIVLILISVAFYTLIERKIMASIQRRKGPNVVGFWGLLQPFADGIKLVIKETVLPTVANRTLFIFAPFLSFTLSILGLMPGLMKISLYVRILI